MGAVNVLFMGGPLDQQEMILPELRSPYQWTQFEPEPMIRADSTDTDVTIHNYHLDVRDYEERREAIDNGAPILFVHESISMVWVQLISIDTEEFQATIDRVSTVMQAFMEEAIEFFERMHTAPECETLPNHEVCWPRGERPSDEQAEFINYLPDEPDWHDPDYEHAEGCIQTYVMDDPVNGRYPCSCSLERRFPEQEVVQSLPGSLRVNAPYDPHNYDTPWHDEGGGVSAEELVPGIEQALRDWADTKKEITNATDTE